MWGESSADGAGLLGSQIKREVFLVLVVNSEGGALVGVDDGKDLCDRLAEIMARETFESESHTFFSFRFSLQKICLHNSPDRKKLGVAAKK